MTPEMRMRLLGLHPTQLGATLRTASFRLAGRLGVESPFSREAHDFERFKASRRSMSRSQIFQDLFVLWWTRERRNGWFVEFGACDGVRLSNTVLLEREYGWTGVLAEPARSWHDRLAAGRSCRIDHRCVWSAGGQSLEFSEAAEAEYSTLAARAGRGLYSDRTAGDPAASYRVPTVSLVDLLREHDAPREIDLLSIDTEGSELEILSAFDFSAYRISTITVEHNFAPKRRLALRKLLEPHGYRRCLVEHSMYDDWYVLDPGPGQARRRKTTS